MNFPYLELPDGSGWPRPLLDVTIGDVEEMRVRCLADSGALNTLLPGWVAAMVGIDLPGAPA